MLVSKPRCRAAAKAIEALIAGECFMPGIVDKDEKVVRGGG
jgi:hypothetical protein